MGSVRNIPLLSDDAQSQPLNQVPLFLGQNTHWSVLVCTLNADFEIMSPGFEI